jgi:hypothetical protein
VSTRSEPEKRGVRRGSSDAAPARLGRSRDPVQEIAIVALAKRPVLLRAHHFRLRHEDLEDCYSQATLELVTHVRNGGAFADRVHVANALELRFLSRVRDRRRALCGRSPIQAALEKAAPIGGASVGDLEIVDERAAVEKLVMLRDDLRGIERLACQLTVDQRMALGSELSGEGCRAFCSRSGWSPEKYRKVAQRARARLRRLMVAAESGVPGERGVSEKESGPAYDYFSPHS